MSYPLSLILMKPSILNEYDFIYHIYTRIGIFLYLGIRMAYGWNTWHVGQTWPLLPSRSVFWAVVWSGRPSAGSWPGARWRPSCWTRNQRVNRNRFGSFRAHLNMEIFFEISRCDIHKKKVMYMVYVSMIMNLRLIIDIVRQDQEKSRIGSGVSAGNTGIACTLLGVAKAGAFGRWKSNWLEPSPGRTTVG